MEEISQRGAVPLGPYWRLLQAALRQKRTAILLQVALSVALSIVPSLQVILTRHVFDGIVAALSGTGMMRVGVLLAAQAGLALAVTVTSGWKQRHLAGLSEQITFHMKSEMLRKTWQLELTQLENPDYYDAHNRAEGAMHRGVQVVDGVLVALQAFLTTVSYAVVVARFHWSFPLLLPVFALPNLVIGSRMAQRVVARNRGMTPLMRTLMYIEDLMTNRSAAKELRVFGIYHYLFDRFTHLFRKGMQERALMLKEQEASTAGLSLLDQCVTAAITLSVLWFASRGHWSLGAYVALVQAISGTQGSVESLAKKCAELYGSVLQMGDYFSFLSIPERPGVRERPRTAVMPAAVDSIQVSDLSFVYPGHDRPAVQEISFRVNRGEIVAIVGENGCGKTTLAKCLLGLYTPTIGAVSYSGVDISAVPREDLYRRVSALFQDFAQYELAVRENVGFGNVAKIDDDDALWHAVQAAQLENLVNRLPNGLDSPLGVMFASGHELSIGQWQRFALARVFLKDADVILLDEPTAALDPHSEVKLFQRVKQVYRSDRIVFLISHRLGICRDVDRILVLKDGRLVENGDHVTLLARNGIYAGMFRAQADMYTDVPDATASSLVQPTV
jgi:ATP-binding cassette subfamily B protein